MATKQEYTNVAPYVMAIGDFDPTAVNTKLDAIPAAPTKTPIADPAKADVIALFNTLYTDYYSVAKAIEDNGGILKLAKANNMTAPQCVTCIREFEAMRALREAELNQ
jgi:hypothetical protein